MTTTAGRDPTEKVHQFTPHEKTPAPLLPTEPLCSRPIDLAKSVDVRVLNKDFHIAYMVHRKHPTVALY